MRFSTWLLVLILFVQCLNSTEHAAEKSPAPAGKAILVHDYKEHDNQLVDISPDGTLMLVETRKPCPRELPTSHLFCTVFVVYDVNTGKRVGDLALDDIQNGQASFEKNNRIIIFERGSNSVLEWDPISGNKLTLPSDVKESIKTTGTGVLCSVGDGRFLAIASQKVQPDLTIETLKKASTAELTALRKTPCCRYTLETLDATGLHELQQPAFHDHPNDFGSLTQAISDNCHSWKAGSAFLIPYHDDEYDTSVPGYSRKRETNLVWVSSDAAVPSRLCRSFTSEFVYGHTISPDGSIIVVVTSEMDLLGLRDRPIEAFLNVLDAATCSTLKRWLLAFPDGEPGGGGQFARQMAISPNKGLLALSFGRFNDNFFNSSARTFFALYSLSDGHWLTTLRGDQTRGAKWISLSGAPITGDLRFSPDSRFFLGTSWHVRQWDVSLLR